MKTLVAYYSYTGKTRRLAQEIAGQEAADITEIKDVRPFGKAKAFVLGCVAAIGGKSWPIQPPEADFSQYDRFILMAPIWAGNPVPEFNAMLGLLPEGKTVSIKMVSSGGDSDCREKLEAAVAAKGCTLESFENLKG